MVSGTTASDLSLRNYRQRVSYIIIMTTYSLTH